MTPDDTNDKHLNYRGLDRESIARSLTNLLVYAMGKDRITATHRDWLHTAALAVRERLIERWMASASTGRHSAFD